MKNTFTSSEGSSSDQNALKALGVSSKKADIFDAEAVPEHFNTVIKQQLPKREKPSDRYWKDWEEFWDNRRDRPAVMMKGWKLNPEGKIVINGKLDIEHTRFDEIPEGIEQVSDRFAVSKTRGSALGFIPERVGEMFIRLCWELESLKGLENVKIERQLSIMECNALKTMQHCPVVDDISLCYCEKLQNLIGLPETMNNVEIDILKGLRSSKGIPRHVRGNLMFIECMVLEELILPDFIEGDLTLQGLDYDYFPDNCVVKGKIIIDGAAQPNLYKALCERQAQKGDIIVILDS